MQLYQCLTQQKGAFKTGLERGHPWLCQGQFLWRMEAENTGLGSVRDWRKWRPAGRERGEIGSWRMKVFFADETELTQFLGRSEESGDGESYLR